MKYILLLTLPLIITFIVAGCQAIAADDQSLQYQADLIAYNTEVARLRSRMQIERTEVAQLVEEAAYQASESSRYNQLLASTIVAAMPPTPTPPFVSGDTGAAMRPEMFDLSDGVMRFEQVGIALELNPEDGCFMRQTRFINAESQRIYLTALALNLRAGSQFRATWQYGGEIVHITSWIAPESANGQCIALELRPTNAPFLAGNWTATLSVNGDALDPLPFTIVGS